MGQPKEKPLLELTLMGAAAPLAVHHFSIRETIAEPFVVTLIARTQRPDLGLDAIVGKEASLRIQNRGVRLWKGICRTIEQVAGQAETQGVSTYCITIVPNLWLLGQRTNHRIFKHLSIVDIARSLLAEWRIPTTFEVGTYPLREYVTQFGESDYAFLSRLLEDAGITFIFRDQNGSGTKLVISDRLHGATARDAIKFVDNPNPESDKEFFSLVRLTHEVRPGAAMIRDWDFRNPSYSLFGQANPAAAPEQQYEQYLYAPGAFLVEGKGGGSTPVADAAGVYRHMEPYGNELAQKHLDALRADKLHVYFETNVVDLYPGAIFSIEEHLHPDLAPSTRLMVTEFAMQGSPGDEWKICGRAVVIDQAKPYRPARKTPKPRVWGLHSATVTRGSAGVSANQEIQTDEFGRVYVQFPWSTNTPETSCWVRVSQGWAGTGYGMITIPRIGQEVLIAFVHGDPDQPIVAGRVFNALQTVPYKLPDEMTVSTWKTQSSPATGGFNELKFDDKAGAELVYVQAEKDLQKLVKNDEIERTERDKLTTVGRNEDVVVKGVRKQLVIESDHLHVKMDQNTTVDGGVSLTVQAAKQEKIGTDYALDAGTEIHLKAGMTMVLEAGIRLTLKGLGGFIDIGPTGIDIMGLMVNINSGGLPGFGSGASPKPAEEAVEAQPTGKGAPGSGGNGNA